MTDANGPDWNDMTFGVDTAYNYTYNDLHR